MTPGVTGLIERIGPLSTFSHPNTCSLASGSLSWSERPAGTGEAREASQPSPKSEELKAGVTHVTRGATAPRRTCCLSVCGKNSPERVDLV